MQHAAKPNRSGTSDSDITVVAADARTVQCSGIEAPATRATRGSNATTPRRAVFVWPVPPVRYLIRLNRGTLGSGGDMIFAGLFDAVMA